MLKEILGKLWEDSISEIDKEASEKDLQKKVYDYLSEDYPKSTINWVTKGKWRKESVKLSDVMMGRRPGGARETGKTKAIQEKYEKGEKLDPVVIVKDGDDKMRLADGYHRTLAKRKAGFTDIDAYIMETNEKEGPWLKEMHEKKLSKGIKHVGEGISKKAHMTKEANPASAIGRFMSNAWGGKTRAARKNLKEVKPKYKDAKKEFKTNQNNSDFLATKNEYNRAKKNYKQERNKTFGARVGLVGAGTALSGANNVKNSWEGGEEFKQKRAELEQRKKEIEEQLN